MLRVLGSRRRLCDGQSRREFLQAGSLALSGLGLGSLGLSDLLQLQQATAGEASSVSSFGRAKSIILIHLYGSPSQLEWADMKPNAPVEVRGEFGSIPSSLPGCDVCELLPNMARVMDRTTVIRSMTHPYPVHGVAFALTGVPTIDVAMELSPYDPKHWPFFGSVVEYVDRLREAQAAEAVGKTPAAHAVPTNIGLPFPFSSHRTGEVPRAGPYAAFLGGQFNPVWTDFLGQATKSFPKELAGKKFTDNDPYIGVAPDSYFMIPSATDPQPGMTLDRLDGRRSLLRQFEEARRGFDQQTSSAQLNRHQETAFAILNSNLLRQALDLRRERDDVRSLYGDTLFGQACLAARRLVEAGSRVVTVFWDEFGLAGDAWDTHYNHFDRMRNALCPGLDLAWYGLINDLEQRGLLDETLVVCTSEHGRTPKITNNGRDHWSRAYTTMLAGGGTARGRVVGATDQQGGEVADRPVSPKDLLATMYHLLGIDHRMMIRDGLGRPLPLVEGEVVHEALA